jgi:hypothetical protein
MILKIVLLYCFVHGLPLNIKRYKSYFGFVYVTLQIKSHRSQWREDFCKIILHVKFHFFRKIVFYWKIFFDGSTGLNLRPVGSKAGAPTIKPHRSVIYNGLSVFLSTINNIFNGIQIMHTLVYYLIARD